MKTYLASEFLFLFCFAFSARAADSNCLLKDNEEQFQIEGNVRTCQWVQRLARLRCNESEIARENCPEICNVCEDSLCEDISILNLILFSVDGVERSCMWVKNDLQERCKLAPAIKLCPSTCSLPCTSETDGDGGDNDKGDNSEVDGSAPAANKRDSMSGGISWHQNFLLSCGTMIATIATTLIYA